MKKSKLLIRIGLLLVAAALFLAAYNAWDNLRAGKASEDVLEKLAPKICEDPVPTGGRQAEGSSEIEFPDYILNPNMNMPTEEIDGRDYVGMISIPALGRELPVLNSWDYENLKIAPCRYTGSAYLDSMVICAHNYDIHFGQLKSLNYGDTVIFTDTDGNEFVYEVTEIEVIDPYSIDEMTETEWDLTLFTCTVGGASRVTVRCARRDR